MSNRNKTSFIPSYAIKLVFYCLAGFMVSFILIGCGLQHSGMINAKGLIAYEERKLFFDTLALMLIVVLPVIIMSFAFVYHYQASHRVRDYKPNWSHSYFLESLWWGIPIIIIMVLGVMTWIKTHELDPYRPIAKQEQSPLIIQAIALPWKWLFIYPEHDIATINYIQIPIGRQVEFWVTTDNTPMSAFFIPQLGSQVYAMAGMRTRLHLLADQEGSYDGLNSQFSGDGFAQMHFTVDVVFPNQLQKWIQDTKLAKTHLSDDVYKELLNPTINNQKQFYSGVKNNLFNDVIHLYANSYGDKHPRSDRLKFHYPEEA